jgi:hypothetical protein
MILHDIIIILIDINNNQYDRAFNLGYIISALFIINGINMLPNPPIDIGIIIKDIINNP